MNRLALLVSALAAATALAQPAPPERPAAALTVQSGPTAHVVQPGDSLIKIGRAYGVSVEDLRKANNLTSDLIVAGRKLTIPSPPAPAECVSAPTEMESPPISAMAHPAGGQTDSATRFSLCAALRLAGTFPPTGRVLRPLVVDG